MTYLSLPFIGLYLEIIMNHYDLLHNVITISRRPKKSSYRRLYYIQTFCSYMRAILIFIILNGEKSIDIHLLQKRHSYISFKVV